VDGVDDIILGGTLRYARFKFKSQLKHFFWANKGYHPIIGLLASADINQRNIGGKLRPETFVVPQQLWPTFQTFHDAPHYFT